MLNAEAVQMAGTAFGATRVFLHNRLVYLVLSSRARGLSIGVNVNPGKDCNFKCIYCEVDRTVKARDELVNVPAMKAELETILTLAKENRIRELAPFANLPVELLSLKEVALSGDGEPTLSPQFEHIVREIVAVRSRGHFGFFKIVLITNTAGLPLTEVRKGLSLLTSRDEIWVKLDAGTQDYMDKINSADIKLATVMANILAVALERSVVVQSLFPLLRDEEPSNNEIDHYVHRLQELKGAGAQISSVQIYSAHRPPHPPECGHLALRSLSRIARRVRAETGLKAIVF